MNIAALAGPGRTPACWDKPALFSATALDYDPRDEAYEHLDLLGHTILAARKRAAEEAAVDVCFGCPLMLACEEIDEKNMSNPRVAFIAGVIGGRTEAERRARRAGRPLLVEAKTISVPNPQIAPGDRGPRNQVDDELVARLTNAGRTSDQIARDLGCSPRTVSRARKRMGIHSKSACATPAAAPAAEATAPTAAPTAAPVTEAASVTADASSAPVDAFTAQAVAATAESVARTRTASNVTTLQQGTRNTQTAATTAAITSGSASGSASVPPMSPNPFINGRPISPAMEAVYNHLARVGGSDTLENLFAVAIPHVDPTEAIEWWTKHNSVTENGQKVLRAAKANTPTVDRIREGARAKVFNSISATHRKGRYLDRDGDIFTFKPHAFAAWNERLNALTAA